jgi:hypothetical protein
MRFPTRAQVVEAGQFHFRLAILVPPPRVTGWRGDWGGAYNPTALLNHRGWRTAHYRPRTERR